MSSAIPGSTHSTGQGRDHDPELHLRLPRGHLRLCLVVCLLQGLGAPREQGFWLCLVPRGTRSGIQEALGEPLFCKVVRGAGRLSSRECTWGEQELRARTDRIESQPARAPSRLCHLLDKRFWASRFALGPPLSHL